MLRQLYGRVLFTHRGTRLRQQFYKRGVVWSVSVERFQCIARLFSGGLCASSVAGNALYPSKPHLIIGLGFLGIKMELSQSGFQQSNGLVVISLKSQLVDLG